MIQYSQQLNNASQLFITTSILETKLLVTNLVFIYKLINSFKTLSGKNFLFNQKTLYDKKVCCNPCGEGLMAGKLELLLHTTEKNTLLSVKQICLWAQYGNDWFLSINTSKNKIPSDILLFLLFQSNFNVF